jgi:serralysin
MAGTDTVFGGAGDDVIAWNDPDGDEVYGDGGNDTIIGGNVAADTIFGGDGDDLIRAFATEAGAATASDQLSGNAGDDVLLGGNAADTIEGGADDDTMGGNGGPDVFVFDAGESTGDDVITDFNRADDTVRLVGFGTGFDPLANLSQAADGTLLDLGDGDGVLFLGRLVAEFAADDFVLV